MGAPDVGARPLQILADDLIVRDVTVAGRQNRGRGMMRFDVTNPDGIGLVERMHLPDGAAVGTGTVGCLVGPASTGPGTLSPPRVSTGAVPMYPTRAGKFVVPDVPCAARRRPRSFGAGWRARLRWAVLPSTTDRECWPSTPRG